MSNYIATPEEAEYYTTKLFGLIQSGDLKINIFKVYPFSAEGAKEAQSDLTGGKTTGKVLIKVNPDAE
jgi:NADPH:quinone reductase